MEKPFLCIAETILQCPFAFWGLATVFSAYYGYRAIIIQKQNVETQNKKYETANSIEKPDAETIKLQGRPWTPCEKIMVQTIQDVIFNVAHSMAGWGALRVLCYMYVKFSFSQLTPSISAIVIFLVYWAVNGISGTLPHLTMLGRLFGGK